MSRNPLLILMMWALFSLTMAEKTSDLHLEITETRGTINASITLDEYTVDESIVKDGAAYSQLIVAGAVKTSEEGAPELPYKQYNFQLAGNTDATVEIVKSEYKEIVLTNDMLPARRTIYRNEDPATVPFVKGATYDKDAFYPAKQVALLEPYLLREARGITLQVYPVQYNPVTKVVRIYTTLEVKITQVESATAINAAPASPRTLSPEMENLYSSLFVNYSRWDNAVAEEGDMLVIHTSRDKETIKAFVDHKKSYNKYVKNITTQEVSTGTNVKQTIKDAYAENPNLLYVQLVGDWADIKCDLGGGASAPMDPMLGCVSGSDNYPDIIIGRFSCKDAATLTPQIDKAIAYESNGMQPWMLKGMGIASDEGGSTGKGDDGEPDYTHMDIIKENKLIANGGFTNVAEVYKSGTKSEVAGHINDGLGLINYVGHGQHDKWSTTGFGNNEIKSLANEATPIIISVACINGEFHKGADCFAEGWLRQKDGGAVATVMATINQPWDPPMRGQDYMNDLITGGYDYSSNPGTGTSTTEGRQTFGSVVFNGLVLMYAEKSSTSDLQTIQTWTIFGDCSLDMRPTEETGGPTDLKLSSNVVDENDEGAKIGFVVVSNSNSDATHTFTIDDDRFVVKDDILKLASGESLNFEEEEEVTITITVKDEDDNSYSEEFEIVVGNVNDAPVVSTIEDQTVKEGSPFKGIKLSEYVADEDNSDDEISWTSTTPDYLKIEITSSSYVQLVTTTSGAFITVLDEDWNGSETVTFTATDPEGLSDETEVTFTVTPVNDAPVLAEPLEDVIIENNSSKTISVADVFTDIDNEELTITAERDESDELPSWIEIDGDEIILDPGKDVLDTFDLIVSASDGEYSVSDTFEVLVKEGVAIIEVDGNITKGSELLFAPNPVPIEVSEVFFVTPSNLRGEWSVAIYDNLGNLLDEATFTGAGGKRYAWDLRNKDGVAVGAGTYVAVISYTDKKGNVKEYKRSIGVKR